MIDKATLRTIAAAKLEDAEVLLMNGRYDGEVYICGYAIELALKARICDTLNWQSYPETKNEFQYYRSFKVHNLEVLLHLSGQEDTIRSDSVHLANWSIVGKWNPETRYRAIGAVSPIDAQDFLKSAKHLLMLL